MSLPHGTHGSESWNRRETLIELAGPNEIRAAELTIVAALWSDRLAAQFVRQVKSWLFNDSLLRAAAEYSTGTVSTYGVADLRAVDRLLQDRFTSQAVAIVSATIYKLIDLLDASVVEDAIELLTNRLRVTA